jgi:transcriptional regulator with XRE-family HTH domain
MAKKYGSREMAGFLKESRMAAGLTQTEVASKLGYSSAQFVSNWERGLSSPPIKTLARLIKIYKVNPNVVMELCLMPLKRELSRVLTGKASGSSGKRK